MAEYMLSTTDNPFNPFTHFNEWNSYDIISGYRTLEFLGRIVVWAEELSEEDQGLAIDAAIDEIVQENVLGIYIKVTPDTVPRVLARAAS